MSRIPRNPYLNSRTNATTARPGHKPLLAAVAAATMLLGAGSLLAPVSAVAQNFPGVFQRAEINDADPDNVVLPFPCDAEAVLAEGKCETALPLAGPTPTSIGGTATANFSNIVVTPGAGTIGGDVIEFDITITNTSPVGSGINLTAYAFQSKFSESPALGSRIGDKAYLAVFTSPPPVTAAFQSIKKNGTSNGLFTGKWKGICINSSTDYIVEFNSGLANESLECSGGRKDEFAVDDAGVQIPGSGPDGNPELAFDAGTGVRGLAPGASETVRLRLDAGTTDGALHRVPSTPATLSGIVLGTPIVGPNGLTYYEPSIDTSDAGRNVIEIVEFGDNKVIRAADGSFDPSFAPTITGNTVGVNEFLTLPRKSVAFSDILGRNHTCGTYGLTLGACGGGAGTSPVLNFLDTGDLIAGVQNFAAILRGFGEYTADASGNPIGTPGVDETRPIQPYGVLCENCGGIPYVPIAEFYVDNGIVGGQQTVLREIAAGSYGDPVSAPYAATIDPLGAGTSFKQEILVVATGEEIEPTEVVEPCPPQNPDCGTSDPVAFGASAAADFSNLSVLPGAGQNGGDAIFFTVTITNTSPADSDIFLTAFNYQTKRRGLADINILDGTTQDRRDVRLDSTLDPCTGIDDESCWNADLGVGHFPNVIGNGLLFGQMVWTDANAGREPDPVDGDQVFVDPSGINPTPYLLESVKKNGPFTPILKGNVNFICIKSGLFLLDPDADGACAGDPAILIDPAVDPIVANIVNEGPNAGRLGLSPGASQTVRMRMDFGDNRGAVLRVVTGDLPGSGTVIDPDGPGTLGNQGGTAAGDIFGLRRFFDCSDQRELEYCHPELVGANIGYLPNTSATWLTPVTLEEIEYVILNQPGNAPSVMQFATDVSGTGIPNFGYILRMAGFRPSAEFYKPDTNPELPASHAGVLIRQQVIGEYVLPAPAAPLITSLAIQNGDQGDPYSYDVDASGFPSATFSLLQSPAGMAIEAGSGLISWPSPVAGTFPVEVRAQNGHGSDTQLFSLKIAGPPAPSANLLDNFNRTHSYLFPNWAGATGGSYYSLNGSKLKAASGGVAFWKKASFGVNQVAQLELSSLPSTTSGSYSVVLKWSTASGGTGVKVTFAPTSANATKVFGNVSIHRKTGSAWQLIGSAVGVDYPKSSTPTLTGQVTGDGTVMAYLNGAYVTAAQAGSTFASPRTGYIGLSIDGAPNALADNFKGRTIDVGLASNN